MRLNKSIYHAAMYLRLSCDDGDKAESNSIQNQRVLIKEYIDSHPGLELAGEFSDDGYSGTTFDRPGFQKMMEQVQKQKIDCIIVKDLSRFGRNYIETGKYLERLFPALGIRFIAITDHYDSEDDQNEMDNIILPFKNLINDAYCRDISIKIRSQLDVKRKNGDYVGGLFPFGYKKDPGNKNHLVIDEPAAEVVREIFNLKLEGYSPAGIAAKLNERGILTPAEYKKANGITTCSLGRFKSEVPAWNHIMVGRILKNEEYIGTVVQGKTVKINYKVKRERPVDKSEWIRVPDKHEPIVPKYIFDIVQKLLAMDTRVAPGKETVLPLSGFVHCGDCGQNMVNRTLRRGKRSYMYFHCTTNKNQLGCTSHQINAARLEQVVLDAMRNHISLLLDAESLISKIDSFPRGKPRLKGFEQQIKSLDDEIRHYQELKEKLYEDYRQGVVDMDEYDELKNRFTAKMDRAFDTQVHLESKRQEVMKEAFLIPEWMHEIKEFRNLETLTRRAVAMLLDEVIVYSKYKVEVRFRFEDELREYLDAVGKKEDGENDISEGLEVAAG